MPYIGKEPVVGNFVKLDAISVVNGQAAYTMNNGGSAFTAYDNVNQFLVSLNGVLQAPTDSFTVSGSTLTFASNLATGDVIDFVIVLGNTLDIGTPSDNTVSLAKLTATGTKDATTFLRGDNTFATAGGTNTPAFEAKMSADQTISDDVVTKVQFDTETFDTDSCYDNSTNYRFTPTTAGKYYVYSTIRSDSTSNSTIAQVDVIIYKNGSAYSSAGSNFSTNYIAEHAPTVTNVIDFNGSTDYVEIYVRNNATGGTLKVQADTFTTSSTFGAYKIIE